MSFRKNYNNQSQWVVMTMRCAQLLDALCSIQGHLTTPDAFEHLIQNDDETLNALDEIQWMHLNAIVDLYSVDWQSWFTATGYPAFFRQRKLRPWTPTEIPLAARDFESSRLLVHLWSHWNEEARTFEAYFKQVAIHFNRQITMRSFNVDWSQFTEHLSPEDRMYGAGLAFYQNGVRVRTIAEYPSHDALQAILDNWVGA